MDTYNSEFDLYVSKPISESGKEPEIAITPDEQKQIPPKADLEEAEIDVFSLILISSEKLAVETSLQILKYECYVSKFIKTYGKEQENMPKMLLLLDWLAQASLVLLTRTGQKVLPLKSNILEDKIVRCSYKFCQKAEECSHFYNRTKKFAPCNAQHYVYNILYNDIKSVYNYITEKKENLNIDEINKSVNTIYFVITHMYNELFNADYYSGGTYVSVHDNIGTVSPKVPSNIWTPVEKKTNNYRDKRDSYRPERSQERVSRGRGGRGRGRGERSSRGQQVNKAVPTTQTVETTKL